MSVKINAGAKILDGLRDALSGNFAAVMIEGQRWIRAPAWQPIDSAPRDGKTIFAEHWQTGQRGMVHFNSQGEWELVDGLTNTPMGKGFYPTHWQHLPNPPVTA